MKVLTLPFSEIRRKFGYSHSYDRTMETLIHQYQQVGKCDGTMLNYLVLDT